jgi:hypothetical protein
MYFLAIIFFFAGGALVWLYLRNRHKEPNDELRAQLKAEKEINEKLLHTLSPKQDAPVVFPDNKHEDLKKQIDTLYIVNDLGRKLTSSLHLEQTFHHLNTTLNSMMDAAITELCVYDETGNKRMLSSVGDGIPYDNPFSEWCYNNNREVILGNAPRDYGRYVFRKHISPRAASSVVDLFPCAFG